MSRSDHILYMLKSNQQVTRKLIDDITEEQSMVRGKDQGNHIRWQTGHITYCAGIILSLLGEKIDEHNKFQKMFGGGSVISEISADYPSMAELKEHLYRYQDRAIELAGKLSDADLEKETGEENNRVPIWRPITFLCMHEFYHDGQIVNTRKTIGKERPFD